MTRIPAPRLVVFCLILAASFTGCSRDPNVRKQKYFESGERYFAKAKYREAAIQFSNAVQLDPKFAEAHYQLGEAYLRLQDWPRAYQALNRAVELNPDNYPARIDIANMLVATRQAESLRSAKTHLDVLREKQPNNAVVYEAWANYYGAQDNFPAAIDEMKKGITFDPNRSESYLNLALLQLRSNLPDQAEVNFKKATELDPKAMNAQLALAGFYQSRNRLPEAEQQFRHAVEIAPKDPAPRAALVRLLMAEGKRSEIEPFLQQTKRAIPDNSEGYRMLGDYYFATGDLDKAMAEYGSLYKDYPKDAQVKKNYIQILILKNRLDEADNLNNEVLKKNARDVDALICAGQIRMRRGDANGAVDALQNALKNDRDNAIAHYQLGMAFDLQHNENRAEAEWREAVRLKADLTDAQRALAALEIRRGDSNGLTLTAEELIAAQPYAPDGYLFRSMAEINQQRYADAEQDVRKAMERAPQSTAPLIQMGNVHLAQKHFDQAIAYYQQALDRDPSSSDGLSGILNTYFAAKQPEKAIAAAQAQIAKVPNNSNFYDLLGTALFNGRKDLPGAEAALRKALELDKNNIDAVEKLGKVEVQKGAPDQALALYQQAVKDNPHEVRFLILSGELYEAKQDWEHAKGMYQQALSISPDNPLAANNLAYVILQEGGNVDVALAMAQNARRGMPDSPNAADTLGWAYYQKGVYRSAIEMFQESLRLTEKNGGSDDPTVHYHLGLAYQKSNEPKLARQHLEKVLKLSPNYSNAQEVRKALSELRG